MGYVLCIVHSGDQSPQRSQIIIWSKRFAFKNYFFYMIKKKTKTGFEDILSVKLPQICDHQEACRAWRGSYLCMSRSHSQTPGEQGNMAAVWPCLAKSSLLQLLNTGCSAGSFLRPLHKELQQQLGLCGRGVDAQATSPSCFFVHLEDCCGGGGLSSNLISGVGVLPLRLTLPPCTELLSDHGAALPLASLFI